jgi:hypothetical protein
MTCLIATVGPLPIRHPSTRMLKSEFVSLDEYTLRARLAPAVIADMPAFAFAAILVSWGKLGLPHVIASLGLTVLFAALLDIARRRGRKIEPGLIPKMGGLPHCAATRRAACCRRRDRRAVRDRRRARQCRRLCRQRSHFARPPCAVGRGSMIASASGFSKRACGRRSGLSGSNSANGSCGG